MLKNSKAVKLFFIDAAGNCVFDNSFKLFDYQAESVKKLAAQLAEELRLLELVNITVLDDAVLCAALLEDVYQLGGKERVTVSFDEAIKFLEQGKITNSYTLCSLLLAERHKLLNSKVPVLYEDDQLVAVNKPPGILVHRSTQSSDRTFLLQKVRDTVKCRVSPIHRLDRPTSGIVLFGKDDSATSELFSQFRNSSVGKFYIALVRGYTADHEVIDYPLKNLKKSTNSAQEAVTEYETLARTEVPYAVGRYEKSRYSLVKIKLHSGRTHQIRRHFHHISHPLVGDTVYGDGRHNKLFRAEFNSFRLMLMAVALKFKHPVSNEEIKLALAPDYSFRNALEKIGIPPVSYDEIHSWF